MWSHISTGQLSASSDKSAEDWFKEAPKTVNAIDREWKAQWIIIHSEEALDETIIGRIDDVGDMALEDMFRMFTKMQGTEQLPKEFQEKALANLAFRVRMHSIGGASIALWVDRYVDTRSGQIDWAGGAAYTFTASQGILVTAKHHSGCQAPIPEWMRIVEGTKLLSPAIDTLTAFDMQPKPVPISQFFADGSGPNNHVFDKKGRAMKAWLQQAQQVLQGTRAFSGSTATVGSVKLRDYTKEKRVAGLEIARAKMAERPKRPRTIHLNVDLV